MIVTVTANPAVDRTYHLAALRPGALHPATTLWAEASARASTWAGCGAGSACRLA
jgi:hypothetical protein